MRLRYPLSITNTHFIVDDVPLKYLIGLLVSWWLVGVWLISIMLAMWCCWLMMPTSSCSAFFIGWMRVQAGLKCLNHRQLVENCCAVVSTKFNGVDCLFALPICSYSLQTCLYPDQISYLFQFYDFAGLVISIHPNRILPLLLPIKFRDSWGLHFLSPLGLYS